MDDSIELFMFGDAKSELEPDGGKVSLPALL